MPVLSRLSCDEYPARLLFAWKRIGLYLCEEIGKIHPQTCELIAVRACALRISRALSFDNILLTLFSVGLSLLFLPRPVILTIIVLKVMEQRRQPRQPMNTTNIRMPAVHKAIDSARDMAIIITITDFLALLYCYEHPSIFLNNIVFISLQAAGVLVLVLDLHH